MNIYYFRLNIFKKGTFKGRAWDVRIIYASPSLSHETFFAWVSIWIQKYRYLCLNVCSATSGVLQFCFFSQKRSLNQTFFRLDLFLYSLKRFVNIQKRAFLKFLFFTDIFYYFPDNISRLDQRCFKVVDQRWDNVDPTLKWKKNYVGFSTLHNVDTTLDPVDETTSKQRTLYQRCFNLVSTLNLVST